MSDARVLAYGPHVQVDRLNRAKGAGIPTVLTRGQFDHVLPDSLAAEISSTDLTIRIMPSVLAIAAHPDDIEYTMAGTLLHLGRLGWDLHYVNLCDGSRGSVAMGTIEDEAKKACEILGATFYEPIYPDMEASYSFKNLAKVTAIVRTARPTIILAQPPQDYMEDHETACRLAVSAAFSHGMPNLVSDPPVDPYFDPVTVYHCQPVGNRTPLGELVRPHFFVDVSDLVEDKVQLLACHASQKEWLDKSQGMDSYLQTLRDLNAETGQMSGRFQFARVGANIFTGAFVVPTTIHFGRHSLMSLWKPDFLVIAHRGASGYVPEHTLASKAIAHAMGAHFLEQDVVASRDHHAVVLHDIFLDTVTDVATKFPDRHRPDGRFYVIDFDLAELKTLEVLERFDRRNGDRVFESRFSGGAVGLRIVTLDEEIRFIQGLNATTSRRAGIYPEIKVPHWHRDQGCDLSKIVLGVLKRSGYDAPDSDCYVQCFDEFEVRRIREELQYQGKLIQLIASGHDERSGTDYQRLRSPSGLAEIADYVDGIGPQLNSIISWDSTDSETKVVVKELAGFAKQFGLDVHPWTLRSDALPSACRSVPEAVEGLMSAGVQGVFTDHPDLVLNSLRVANSVD